MLINRSLWPPCFSFCVSPYFHPFSSLHSFPQSFSFASFPCSFSQSSRGLHFFLVIARNLQKCVATMQVSTTTNRFLKSQFENRETWSVQQKARRGRKKIRFLQNFVVLFIPVFSQFRSLLHHRRCPLYSVRWLSPNLLYRSLSHLYHLCHFVFFLVISKMATEAPRSGLSPSSTSPRWPPTPPQKSVEAASAEASSISLQGTLECQAKGTERSIPNGDRSTHVSVIASNSLFLTFVAEFLAPASL